MAYLWQIYVISVTHNISYGCIIWIQLRRILLVTFIAEYYLTAINLLRLYHKIDNRSSKSWIGFFYYFCLRIFKTVYKLRTQKLKTYCLLFSRGAAIPVIYMVISYFVFYILSWQIIFFLFSFGRPKWPVFFLVNLFILQKKKILYYGIIFVLHIYS